MLLKTLGEQKIFCNSMQKLMGDQTMELEECRVTVVQASARTTTIMHCSGPINLLPYVLAFAQEIAKRNQLELKLQQATLDTTQLKMLNHHLEQEILRYQDTLEAVAVINPNQVAVANPNLTLPHFSPTNQLTNYLTNQVEYLLRMHPDFKFRDRNIEFNSSGHVVSNLTTPLVTTAATSGPNASQRDPNPAPAAQRDKPAADPQQESKPTKAVEQSSIAEDREAAEEEAKDPEPTPEKAKAKPLEDTLTDTGGAAEGNNGGVDLEASMTGSSVEKGQDNNTSLDLTTVPPLPLPLPLPAQQTDSTLVVSAEERRLLFRVNWLLQRFRDSVSRDLRIEHTQKSLDLLIEVTTYHDLTYYDRIP